MTINLTPDSLRVFTDFANDAGNWNGSPLIAGNIVLSAADCGNLTDLKKKGLLITEGNGENAWIVFTKAGVDLMGELGIDWYPDFPTV